MTKIMLVEDDNNLREIYEARLAAEGYEIVAAQNGEEALALASKEHPEMIISDVMMPKISGFEMLDILRNTESLRNVKIIMLTALGQAEDSARANSLGADRYLVKSQVTLEDIIKATHELLDGPQAAEPAAETISAPAEDIAPPPPVEQPAPAEPVPAAEPAPEPELPQAPEPEPVAPRLPEPAPAVSIPVSFAPSDDVPPPPAPADDSAPADTSSSSSDISVVEPPAEPAQPVTDTPAATPPASSDDTASGDYEEIAPSLITLPDEPDSTSASTDPGSNVTGASSAVDYTSPTSFNTFQEPPTVPAAVQETEAAAPQSAADAEATIKSQIDDFINTQEAPQAEPAQAASEAQPDTIAVEAEPATTPEPTPEPATAVESVPAELEAAEEANAEAVHEPPADLADVHLPEIAVSSDGSVIEPEAESLDAFQPPVISAPEGITTPEPVTISAPQPEVQETSNDELVTAAAEDLAVENQPVANMAAAPSAKKKVISPLSDSAPKSDIHQLLALEDAKTSAQQAAQTTQPEQPGQPRPNVNAYNPSLPQNPLAPPAASSDTDPNSISL